MLRTQDFSENEDKNHADEETGLLSGTTDASITDNADGETSSKTRETNSEASTKLDEARVQGEILLQTVGDKDRHDQAVDTNDTSHNDGDNVYATWVSDIHSSRMLDNPTLHDEIRAKNTHGGDTNTRLGSAVGGTQAGEDDGASAAHRAKEGLFTCQLRRTWIDSEHRARKRLERPLDCIVRRWPQPS